MSFSYFIAKFEYTAIFVTSENKTGSIAIEFKFLFVIYYFHVIHTSIRNDYEAKFNIQLFPPHFFPFFRYSFFFSSVFFINCSHSSKIQQTFCHIFLKSIALFQYIFRFLFWNLFYLSIFILF